MAWILAAVLAACLICWAPGTGIAEDELDGTRSAEAVEQLRRERAGDASAVSVLTHLARGLATGDLGHSQALNRPVRELLAERLPVTAALIAGGWSLAWMVGLGLATAGLGGRRTRLLPLALMSLLACVPAAVFALACAMAGWPAAAALAAVVTPKVFAYSDGILQRGWAEPYRLMAVARGVPPARVWWSHLLRPAAAEFRALAGVTLPVAIGAAIPVEVFTGAPGVGELAWKAAMGRDVMLLLYLTLILTGVTLATRPVNRDGLGERTHA